MPKNINAMPKTFHPGVYEQLIRLMNSIFGTSTNDMLTDGTSALGTLVRVEI